MAALSRTAVTRLFSWFLPKEFCPIDWYHCLSVVHCDSCNLLALVFFRTTVSNCKLLLVELRYYMPWSSSSLVTMNLSFLNANQFSPILLEISPIQLFPPNWSCGQRRCTGWHPKRNSNKYLKISSQILFECITNFLENTNIYSTQNLQNKCQLLDQLARVISTFIIGNMRLLQNILLFTRLYFIVLTS